MDPLDQILQSLRSSSFRGFALRKQAMEMLDTLPGYDWSGIYRMEDGVLVLDAYVGAATDHTRIEVGVGVCGTAVATGQNQVVDDVRNLSNYLSCSVHTRSEIVVLIRDTSGQILGQIDIDGHETGRFTSTDEVFLEEMGKILAERWSD